MDNPALEFEPTPEAEPSDKLRLAALQLAQGDHLHRTFNIGRIFCMGQKSRVHRKFSFRSSWTVGMFMLKGGSLGSQGPFC